MAMKGVAVGAGVLVLAYAGALLWIARPLPDVDVIGTAGSSLAAVPLAAPGQYTIGRAPETDRIAGAIPGPSAAPTAQSPAHSAGGDPESRHAVSTSAQTYRDPFGSERLVPNHTPAESMARENARRRTMETMRSDAQRDPRGFAARYRLETEDVVAMLEGKRPFPESLVPHEP
jgi:hypothetical protein